MIETLRVVHYGFTDTFSPRTPILSVSESILPEDEDNNDAASDGNNCFMVKTVAKRINTWPSRESIVFKYT